MTFRKSHPLIKIVNNIIIDLPAPSNLRINWNYGSLLGLNMLIQIITGLILATRFTANEVLSFDVVINICQDVQYG
jgi:quinol-cytochrome oxidoreductase complex cytochrome b subunit